MGRRGRVMNRAAQDQIKQGGRVMDTAERLTSFRTRWLTYFDERFPLLGHGIPIALFVFASLAYSRVTQGEPAWPGLLRYAVAFVTVFLTFLQLRILDEFKDFSDDARYRPYRPVPRGLVSLKSLGWLGMLAGCIQLCATALLGAAPLAWLVIVWAYAWLMRLEFLAPRWLRAHAVVYMASHMIIIPLILFYVVACGNVPVSAGYLAAFAATTYFVFCVFEIGRKIRAPADEREGVDMYSRIWGLRRAVFAWLSVLAAVALLAVVSAHPLAGWPWIAAIVAALLIVALIASLRFLHDPKPGSGKVFLMLSGVWMLVLYSALGALSIAGSHGL